jgi:hypothetical protein
VKEEKNTSGETAAAGSVVKFADAGDNRLGIITAVGPGTAVLTVTTDPFRDGSRTFTAEATITVTAMPSATVRIGRNATYTVLGATTRDEVEWDFLHVENGEVISLDDTPFSDGTQTGIRYRLRAEDVGPAILRGTVRVDGEIVRQQTWSLYAVEPISRLAFIRDDAPVRRVDLGIKKGDISSGVPVDFTIEDVRSDTSTILPFEWTVRTKKGQQPIIKHEEISTTDEYGVVTTTIRITADSLIPGSTRLVGVNHNGRKRVSLSVRVVLFPDEGDIRPRSSTISLAVGKAASVRARVTLKGGHRGLTYQLVQGEDRTLVTAESPHPSVTFDNDKLRLTAREVTEGQTPLFVRIIGAPGVNESGVPLPLSAVKDIPVTVNAGR